MRAWLAGKWFLIALAALVAAGFAWPGPAWTVVGPLPFKPVVMVIMFLMAVSLDSSHLAAALRRPAPTAIAVGISYTVLPALAWLLGRLLFPAGNPDLALGLVVAGAVPCTLASATIWTRLARGNDAVALLSTVVSNSLSFVATSLLLNLLTGRETPLDVVHMMTDLFIIIVLPVGVGQLARLVPAVGRQADRAKTLIGVVNRILILIIVFKGAAKASLRLQQPDVTLGLWALAAVVVACVAVHLLAMGAAAGLCRAARVGRPEAIAAGFAASQKTLPVGLYIIGAFYPNAGLAVLPMLFYHILQLTVDSFIADRLASRRA